MGRVDRLWGMRRVIHVATFAAVLALNLAVVAVATAATQCSTTSVVVSANDAELSERICAAAGRAVELLEACGIRQSEPIRIDVIDGLIPNHPNCAGIFHCSESKIELVAPDVLAKALGADHPFMAIPRDRFYDSLVAHEIAHALAYQTRQGPLETIAATEYIAYAMQMLFLAEDVRAAFVSQHPVTEPVKLMALNEVTLTFSPADFAVLAWKHFEAPENGCRFIQRLLNGEELMSIQAFP